MPPRFTCTYSHNLFLFYQSIFHVSLSHLFAESTDFHPHTSIGPNSTLRGRQPTNQNFHCIYCVCVRGHRENAENSYASPGKLNSGHQAWKQATELFYLPTVYIRCKWQLSFCRSYRDFMGTSSLSCLEDTSGSSRHPGPLLLTIFLPPLTPFPLTQRC